MNDLENRKLEELLETVQRPARYTGGEMNAVVKDWSKVRCTFGFCFADTYEIGMSHLGMKILYYLINQREDALCERLFMPDADMADKMRETGVPLFSLESRAALNEFDIIGFTLQYEMSYTNILEMLDLGRVPIRREDRSEQDTIVVAGGPCAFNPEPLAPFIDAFMIGDGEDVMHELIDVIRDGREAGLPRIDILRNLAKLEGVYVPAFYDVAYNEDGTLKSFAPNDPAAPEKNYDFALIFDRPVIYAEGRFDSDEYDAAWLDHPLRKFEHYRMMGLPLTDDMLSNIRDVIDEALVDQTLAEGRRQVREEVWQHRGEAAVRIVDYLMAAHEELGDGKAE